MRIIALLIFIIGISYSCQNKAERILTNYDWEIEKVIDLKTGSVNRTEWNNEKIWGFTADNTYRYKTKDESIENLIKGGWQLNNHNLLIFNEFDSMHVHIEKINTEEMVWVIQGNDSIKFYLNSKAKAMIVPDFPTMNKK